MREVSDYMIDNAKWQIIPLNESEPLRFNWTCLKCGEYFVGMAEEDMDNHKCSNEMENLKSEIVGLSKIVTAQNAAMRNLSWRLDRIVSEFREYRDDIKNAKDLIGKIFDVPTSECDCDDCEYREDD